LDSVSARIDDLVKDGAKRRRLWWSSILDKIVNANDWQPSDQGRHPISVNVDPGMRWRSRLRSTTIWFRRNVEPGS
jgi:hypothetical protein